LVSRIEEASERDWRAASWLLELLAPSEWARPEAGAKDGGLDPTLPAPIINVVIKEDDKSRAARAQFDWRPKEEQTEP